MNLHDLEIIPHGSYSKRAGSGRSGADYVGPTKFMDGSIFGITAPAPMPGTSPIYKPSRLERLLEILKIKKPPSRGLEIPGPKDPYPGFI